MNDDFEATEYNMTVAHSSVFRLEDFSLDSYYNQENLKNGWFEIQRNVDKYTVKKDIHSAYVEAVYQFDAAWILNLGVKYDRVDICVDYDVNKGGEKGSGKIGKNVLFAQSESDNTIPPNRPSAWEPAKHTPYRNPKKFLPIAMLE